ncbi:MAG: hypothetical protein M1484_00870 [Patescibacteria group bacterium]|nr:hypothetical protein [Patescibacteria group bacterium]MCL5431631.1 hypothetical protein [Patescibacteria group bacterium]
MQLSSSRSLAEMKPVLADPGATGPDPVYQVFKELGVDSWVNQTVIAPGRYGQEFPKTFGHYHGVETPEKYHVVSGEGVLQLQKKHLELGFWTPEKMDEVLLIKAGANDELVITPEYGHSWSNVGTAPLVLYDDWTTPHSPADYEAITKLHGLAYYLTEENGAIKLMANKNYEDLPEPVWMTAEEFQRYLRK